MTYAAWFKPSASTRGALATHNQRVIVADTEREIRHAFGDRVEVVELVTVPVRQWLVDCGLTAESIENLLADADDSPDRPPVDHDPRSERTAMTYEFTVREGEQLTLEEAVFQALGTASMCWTETPTGVFDSERAKVVGDALVSWVQEHYVPAPKPGPLGLKPSRWQPLALPGDVEEDASS